MLACGGYNCSKEQQVLYKVQTWVTRDTFLEYSKLSC